jgi:hypothetical protein
MFGINSDQKVFSGDKEQKNEHHADANIYYQAPGYGKRIYVKNDK